MASVSVGGKKLTKKAYQGGTLLHALTSPTQGTVAIGNTPVTAGQWQSGALANALTNPAGTPAAPAVAPQPFDADFEARKQGAQWNISTGDAEAAYQTGQTAWQSGYNADGSLNTSNPYSQAQIFQDNYQRSKMGTQNSMAAQGQLYSGSRLNAQAGVDRRYAEGSSAQRDAASNTYHGIQAGRLANYGSNSLGVSQEQYGALKRAVYGS